MYSGSYTSDGVQGLLKEGGTATDLVLSTSANIDTTANGGDGYITERMRIDSNGDVIIGTTSWSYKKPLNVQGSSVSIIALSNYSLMIHYY